MTELRKPNLQSYPHEDYQLFEQCKRKDEVPVSLIYKLHCTFSKELPFAAPIPTLRINEVELVQAMLQMLQGFSSSLFYWDDNGQSFCSKSGIYLNHISQTSLSSILSQFIHSATCLHLVETFIKKVEMSSLRSPPTLRAFGNSVSVWLKRLRNLALEGEKKIVGSSIGTTTSLLGLVNDLSSLGSGADYLLQLVDGAIPSNYFDNESSIRAAEMAVHILDHLYNKLTEICLVQGGKEEAYLMLLHIFVGSSLPYVEGLDSWIYNGVLDDPYEELFFYANDSVAITQTEFWEKSYLLRSRCGKLAPGSSPLASGIDREHMTSINKEMSNQENFSSSLGGKVRSANNLEVCPLFLADIAKAIVSAGKSLQLIRHIPEDIASCGSCDDHEIDNFGRSKVGNSVSEMHHIESIGELTLSEIFSVSLVGLVGEGKHLNKYFRHDASCGSRRSMFLNSYMEPTKVEDDGETKLASMRSEQFCLKFVVDTVFPKGINNAESCNESLDCFEGVNEENRNVNFKDNLRFTRSFCPENPAITVCQTLLNKNWTSHDKLNVSRNFHLPSLNDEGLRQAIFGGIEGMSSVPKATNYMFGFQYVESENNRAESDMEALELLYPFPTILPSFQEDLQVSELFPFQENSTLTSRVLNWIQGAVPKATPLPVVIMQECLLVYIKKQVDYVGQHILLKLMHGWRLMDELGVLRAIYLLGSGDMLQHFLSVLFNKLDKGESWDDDFELNTVLQESIRNSSDGILLSSPDSLVVSITKQHDSEGNGQYNPASPLSSNLKSRNHHFGIDALDMLKFTYKVPWPLELIANSEAIKKYNQVMGFLLKVKRAKYVLDKARRWMWKGRGTSTSNRKRHWLVEQKLLHFVDAFHQYVMDRVFHNSWLELCEGMASAGSLDEVIEVHEAYLLSIQRQCFVVPEKLWALIANRIKNILGLALDFYSIQQTLSSGGAALAIKARCEMEVDRIERQFDECIAFLLRVLSFKLNVGQFPHLADLVTRINYNYFYMSDSGNLLTVPATDTTFSKIGRSSQ
ncbi:Gamma-tubulin complex component [Thalictrum thalictroides]|uniref:Gamma-tubulin complex component n=1 Tax=Thalictrum thalictroides TaxID=46969 RepID=A0A7J6X3A1_THATH|nr:Gamma-tubulin complex component [Thalictrum thalictroides]